ncbi:DEAD/DEAH box helicase [Arachidicoccus ginsenosidivorans]
MLKGIKEEGAKALVFSQFTGMLHLIAHACLENGIDYYHFDGSTPTPLRHEMVSKFQSEGDDKTVFLISLKAGNAGLNLTAAQYVFLVDPWWNNAVEQQAIDRTHRIGQQSHVFAYRMICKDTIEEKILAIQQKRKCSPMNSSQQKKDLSNKLRRRNWNICLAKAYSACVMLYPRNSW